MSTVQWYQKQLADPTLPSYLVTQYDNVLRTLLTQAQTTYNEGIARCEQRSQA